MSYPLFIDDLRFPPDDGQDWKLARTNDEAIAFVEAMGMPKHIAFDHDLGGDEKAMTFVHWLERYIERNKVDLSNFTFSVHSDNPWGVTNITSLMDQILRVYG